MGVMHGSDMDGTTDTEYYDEDYENVDTGGIDNEPMEINR